MKRYKRGALSSIAFILLGLHFKLPGSGHAQTEFIIRATGPNGN